MAIISRSILTTWISRTACARFSTGLASCAMSARRLNGTLLNRYSLACSQWCQRNAAGCCYRFAWAPPPQTHRANTGRSPSERFAAQCDWCRGLPKALRFVSRRDIVDSMRLVFLRKSNLRVTARQKHAKQLQIRQRNNDVKWDTSSTPRRNSPCCAVTQALAFKLYVRQSTRAECAELAVVGS